VQQIVTARRVTILSHGMLAHQAAGACALLLPCRWCVVLPLPCCGRCPAHLYDLRHPHLHTLGARSSPEQEGAALC
jgi:hypothetical protein